MVHALRNVAWGLWPIMAVATLCLTGCEASSLGLRERAEADGKPVRARPALLAVQSQTPNPIINRTVERKTSGPLSLEEAARAAVIYHPTIGLAESRYNRAGFEIDVANAAYYPSIKAGMNSEQRRDSRERSDWKPQLELSVSQMVYDFGKTASTVSAKEAGYAAQKAKVYNQIDVIARDALEAFIEVQRYTGLQKIAHENVTALELLETLVKDRSEHGASSRSDDMQAAARVQAAKTNRAEIGSQLLKWRATLQSLTGLQSAQLSQKVPQWLETICSSAQSDWEKSPSIAVAEAEKREALAQLEFEKTKAYPTLSVDGVTSYDVLDAGHTDERVDYRVGVNLRSSLYDGGARGASILAATQAANGADEAIKVAKLEANSTIVGAAVQISSIGEMLALLNERDSTLRETRDLYREQYIELGTRTLIDLLNAEQEIHQAGFDRINSQHDLRKLGIVCMYSSGQTRSRLGLSSVVEAGRL
jgi:adhesin transport system outer membrane protein